MFTIKEYVGRWAGSPDWTKARQENAERLRKACLKLEKLARADGVRFAPSPVTNSIISGTSLGGFRPKGTMQGASRSAHKQGLAVDLYDPQGKIDEWCLANSGPGQALEQCGIYIEAPSKTDGWSHWTIRAPKSGNRVFFP